MAHLEISGIDATTTESTQDGYKGDRQRIPKASLDSQNLKGPQQQEEGANVWGIRHGLKGPPGVQRLRTDINLQGHRDCLKL